MSSDLAAAFHSLEDESKAILVKAPGWLGILLAGSDDKISITEMFKSERSRLLITMMDYEFMNQWEKDNEDFVEKVDEDFTNKTAEEIVEATRKALDSMPDSFSTPFRKKLKELMLKVAKASGKTLWFGRKINDEERSMMEYLSQELGIELSEEDFKE